MSRDSENNKFGNTVKTATKMIMPNFGNMIFGKDKFDLNEGISTGLSVASFIWFVLTISALYMAVPCITKRTNTSGKLFELLSAYEFPFLYLIVRGIFAKC